MTVLCLLTESPAFYGKDGKNGCDNVIYEISFIVFVSVTHTKVLNVSFYLCFSLKMFSVVENVKQAFLG